MKLKCLAAGAVFLLSACATLDQNNVDWIPIGPEFPAKKPKEVEFISGRQDVTHPYGNLGLLRIKNIKPGRENLLMGIEKGRKIAASKGADAIQVNQYSASEDGAADPRVTLIIYAIKYVDNLSPEDEKAIEDFSVLGMLNEASQQK